MKKKLTKMKPRLKPQLETLLVKIDKRLKDKMLEKHIKTRKSLTLQVKEALEEYLKPRVGL